MKQNTQTVGLNQTHAITLCTTQQRAALTNALRNHWLSFRGFQPGSPTEHPVVQKPLGVPCCQLLSIPITVHAEFPCAYKQATGHFLARLKHLHARFLQPLHTQTLKPQTITQTFTSEQKQEDACTSSSGGGRPTPQ